MAMSLSSSSSSCSVELSNGNLSTGVRDSHLELIVNISQCTRAECSHPSCYQFKQDVRSLEGSLRKGASHLSEENASTLRLLHEHYTCPCCLPNCRVPWCRFMAFKNAESQEDTLQELMTLLSCPMLTLLPLLTEYDEFITLDDQLGEGGRAVEWEDWVTLCPLSPSCTVALAAPVHRVSTDPPSTHSSHHWVVKMTALQDGDNQLHMLRKLRCLQHPHIIPHIWAASLTAYSSLVICTQFLIGKSVKEVLKMRGKLSYPQARHLFLQALNAAHTLHEMHIVFLNWKCSNLVLDVSEQMLKVSNFGTSVDLSRDNADVGTIKLTLPADIVPAELLQNGRVGLLADSWGLACVALEMVTGMRPWQHLCHESPEDIWKQILAEAPPDVSSGLPRCVQTLTHSCLQKSPSARLSVKDMMDYLYAEMD